MKKLKELQYPHNFIMNSTEIDYSKSRLKRREPFCNITGYFNTEFNDCVRMQNLKNSYCSDETFNNFNRIQTNKRSADESWNNMDTTKRMQTVILNHNSTHLNCEKKRKQRRRRKQNNCLNKNTCSDYSEKSDHSNNTKNYTGEFHNYTIIKLNTTQNTHTNQILPLKDFNSKILENKNKIFDKIDSSDDERYYESSLNKFDDLKAINSNKFNQPNVSSNIMYDEIDSSDNDTYYRPDLKCYDDVLTSQTLKETFGVISENKSRTRNVICDVNNQNFNQTSHKNESSTNKLSKYSKFIDTNIKYSNILYPNVSPTEKMKNRMDNALHAILYIINETVCNNLKSKTNCSDRKLFYRCLKSIVCKRIQTALMGKPVGSRSDIIDTYLRTYPKETDNLIIALHRDCINYQLGSFVPDLIQTGDPKLYYKVNMMRLINTKLKKIITVIENMYQDPDQQLETFLNKPIEKCEKVEKDMKCGIQKCISLTDLKKEDVINSSESFYDKLLSSTIESQFSKLLKKFKNEIVVMILGRESSNGTEQTPKDVITTETNTKSVKNRWD